VATVSNLFKEKFKEKFEGKKISITFLKPLTVQI